MTNAEKYQEVFGFPPDTGNCPAEDCNVCPIGCWNEEPLISSKNWWNNEYKENKE